MTVYTQPEYQNQPQISLPNATAVLVLGILSIVGCCCYGILGVILGIIALVLASKDMKLYRGNPHTYTQKSYSNLNAGRICAIIGLSFSAIYIVMMIFLVGTVGWENLQNPEALQEALENM